MADNLQTQQLQWFEIHRADGKYMWCPICEKWKEYLYVLAVNSEAALWEFGAACECCTVKKVENPQIMYI